MTRIALRRIIPVALVLALVLPISISAAQPSRVRASHHSGAAFTFGRAGGNIEPYSVMIARDGSISSSGDAPTGLASKASLDAIDGLVALARSEGFYALPGLVLCPRSLPDVAGQYVTIKMGTTSRKVTVRGSCRTGFTQLYAVVSAVAGAG
jgi:hypothetical protein